MISSEISKIKIQKIRTELDRKRILAARTAGENLHDVKAGERAKTRIRKTLPLRSSSRHRYLSILVNTPSIWKTLLPRQDPLVKTLSGKNVAGFSPNLQ